jgi:hypothetical protein
MYVQGHSHSLLGVLTQDLCGGTEGNLKKLVSIDDSLTEI